MIDESKKRKEEKEKRLDPELESEIDTIWRCDNCMSYYDTRIQDTPIKDKSDFKLTPHADLIHYPNCRPEQCILNR